MVNVDWDLSNCCETEEIVYLCAFGGFFILNLLLWKTMIMKPMALIAVFAHEMSHATACWWTGGKVVGIEVYNNEGGIAKYSGGWKCLIIPAGYVGCAFWGGAFVALSGDRIGSTVAASILSLALLVSLRYSPNSTVIWLCVGFTTITIAAIVVDWIVFTPVIQFVTLYYGVFVGSYSIRDIYDDTIKRNLSDSDAGACAEKYKCCFPRCVGVQFAIVAIFFQILGLYLGLVWMTST